MIQGITAISRQFSKIRKDVTGIIEENREFFQALDEVKAIHIYGLSFSTIDLPYIKEIISKIDISTVQWEVSYYEDNEEEKFKKTLIELGVPEENISMVKLVDLQPNALQ